MNKRLTTPILMMLLLIGAAISSVFVPHTDPQLQELPERLAVPMPVTDGFVSRSDVSGSDVSRTDVSGADISRDVYGDMYGIGYEDGNVGWGGQDVYSDSYGSFDDYGNYDDYGGYDYSFDYDFGDQSQSGKGNSAGGGLISTILGALGGLFYRSGVKNSYAKSGAGTVYSLRENASLNLTAHSDRQIDTRTTVDRGFYARRTSASAQGIPPGVQGRSGPRP